MDRARHNGFSGTWRTGKSEESFALKHTLDELAKQFGARAHDKRGGIERRVRGTNVQSPRSTGWSDNRCYFPKTSWGHVMGISLAWIARIGR